MRKMSESEVMKEIYNSKKFSNTFSKVNDNIKKLFIDLACESSIFSCNNTDMQKKWQKQDID